MVRLTLAWCMLQFAVSLAIAQDEWSDVSEKWKNRILAEVDRDLALQQQCAGDTASRSRVSKLLDAYCRLMIQAKACELPLEWFLRQQVVRPLSRPDSFQTMLRDSKQFRIRLRRTVRSAVVHTS